MAGLKMIIKDVKIGSTVCLGGDSDKRKLIFGGIKNNMAMLFKNNADVVTGRWETMVSLSHRVKNVEQLK